MWPPAATVLSLTTSSGDPRRELPLFSSLFSLLFFSLFVLLFVFVLLPALSFPVSFLFLFLSTAWPSAVPSTNKSSSTGFSSSRIPGADASESVRALAPDKSLRSVRDDSLGAVGEPEHAYMPSPNTAGATAKNILDIVLTFLLLRLRYVGCVTFFV